MPTSNAFAGVGTVFKRDGVEVAEVTGIGGPGKSRSIHDVTTLNSPGGYREKLGGIKDSGQIVLGLNKDRDVFNLLNADLESSSKQSYTIVLSDTGNTEFDFSGWVIDLPMDIPFDDKVTLNCTIDIDGQIVETS